MFLSGVPQKTVLAENSQIQPGYIRGLDSTMTTQLLVTFLPTQQPTMPCLGPLWALFGGFWHVGVPRRKGVDTGDTAIIRSGDHRVVNPDTYCPHVGTYLTYQTPQSAFYEHPDIGNFLVSGLGAAGTPAQCPVSPGCVRLMWVPGGYGHQTSALRGQ